MSSLLKREFYMDTFGIGDLNDKRNPLAMVTVNPSEGIFPLWPYFQKARRFALYEIGKQLECSLFEFLDQPTWIVDTILDDFAEQHMERITAKQNAEAAAAAQARKLEQSGGVPSRLNLGDLSDFNG